jgi:hypothetical protein
VSAAKSLFHNTWHATEEEALLEESAVQTEIMYSWNHIAATSKELLPLTIPYRARQMDQWGGAKL